MANANLWIYNVDFIYWSFNFILFNLKKFFRKRIKTLIFIFMIPPFFININNVTFEFLQHVFVGFTTKLNDSVLHYETDCRTLFARQPHPLTDGKHAPYTLENQTRYIGEDARFNCKQVIIGFNTSKPHINQVIWHKDGKFLKPDDRHIITWTFKTMKKSQILQDTNIQLFKVTSTLKILMINEDDFGTYNCQVSQRTNFDLPKGDKKTEAPHEHNLQNGRRECACDFSPAKTEEEISLEDIELQFYSVNMFTWNSEFRLIKELPRIKTTFVAPGTLFSFATYYRHLGNTDDISMYYTINGKELVFKDSKCSKFILLYYGLFESRIVQSFNLFAYLPKVAELVHKAGLWNGSISLLQHCVTPNSYGIHDIVILRKVFNERDNTYDVREFNHPLKLDIKPKESDLFDFPTYETNSTVNIDADCWNAEKNSQSSSCILLYRFVERIASDLHFHDNVYFGLAFIALGIFWYTVYRSGKAIVNEMLVVTSSKHVKPIHTLASIPNDDIDKRKYHIFISYSEDEEERARMTASHLEERGLKVFVPNRDIPLGRHKLSEIGKAISQSVAVIVIASNGYVENIETNEFEMNMILQKVKKNNLLVFRVDECVVADIFNDKYVMIDIINDTLNEQTKKISKWFNMNFTSPQVPFKLIMSVLIYMVVTLIGLYYNIKTIIFLIYSK
ncbi:uncharacterized protein LOC126832246 [Patella vulgata]|uniref:uncharacterized protein LOC126832246 n=1 Tax=Patella vulgata TaxID=6465 RepID=UPI0024A7DCB5|nr:uncharacterized protein LOC126832246 [Patella vulgata]XP_050418923.2 uncharacterized protein LOC126832246 [Patella vulgata]XP_055959476.1 uncharacterized protein LOC126832246 [Patella vulgata]